MIHSETCSVHKLAVQSWTAYAVGMTFILLRMYAQVRRLGIKNLQLDDYLMCLAAGFYTSLVVCLNVIAGDGGGNLFKPEKFKNFTPEQIQDRIHGSKIVLVSEQSMLNVIYTIKACMLTIYSRLTLGLRPRKLIPYLSVYVFIGWLSTQVVFFTACRPFKGYWMIPSPNEQCITLEQYAIVQGCFNISSDLLMLAIPLPLITRLNVPLKQKSVLFVIFSMGIFVIVAALLTKISNLSDVWDDPYMLWYVREASVAVYVSNLPLIWPLIREWLPILKTFALRSKLTISNIQNHVTGNSIQRYTAVKSDHRTSGTSSQNAVVTTIEGQRDKDECEKSSKPGTITTQQSLENISKRLPLFYEPSSLGWDLEDQRICMTTTVHVSEEHVKFPSKVFKKENLGKSRRSSFSEPEPAVGLSWFRD